MTCVAAIAELAAVNIFASVTRYTCRACGRFVVRLRNVTRFAGKPCVLAGQREIRLLVVIELPIPPAVRVVAIGAFRAQSAFVFVVFLVAVVAGLWRVLVARRQMALFARCRRVQSDERKSRQPMIEAHLAAP